MTLPFGYWNPTGIYILILYRNVTGIRLQAYIPKPWILGLYNATTDWKTAEQSCTSEERRGYKICFLQRRVRRVLFEKIKVVQLIKKFTFYENRKDIVFKTAHNYHPS
jgi:hypothetical protein